MAINQCWQMEMAGSSAADSSLANSVQGLMNRDQPQLFLRWSKETGRLESVLNGQFVDGVEDVWIEYLSRRYDLAFTTIDSLDDLIELAKPYAKGVVVWDEDVPDTRNVACTIAGLESLLVAHEDQLPMLRDAGLSIVTDLRGRFMGQSRAEVYRWAYETYFDRCDPKTVLSRTVERKLSFDVTSYLQHDPSLNIRLRPISSKDYELGCDLKLALLRTVDGEAVDQIDRNDLAKTFYVTGEKDEKDGADLSNVLEPVEIKLTGTGDKQTYLVLQPIGWYAIDLSSGDNDYEEVYRLPTHPGYGQREGFTIPFDPFMRDFAIARQHFCYDLNAIESFEDEFSLCREIQQRIAPNGVTNGWHAELSSEWDHVAQISKQGNVVNAALSSHNLSFLQHLGRGEPRIAATPTPPALDRDKIYLSFLIADGDALGICYHLQRGMYRESSRGKLPLGWSLNALLADYAPPILQYHLDHASENDSFFAASSGAGYCNPDQMSEENRRRHARWSAEWLAKTGFPGIMFHPTPPHGDTPAYNADADFIQHWAEASAEFGNEIVGVQDGYWSYWPFEHKVVDGFSWARTTVPNASVWGQVEPENMIAAIKALPEKKREGEPLFVPIHPWIDRKIGPDMVADWVDQLGPEFVVVRPDQMLLLIRQWHEAFS